MAVLFISNSSSSAVVNYSAQGKSFKKYTLLWGTLCWVFCVFLAPFITYCSVISHNQYVGYFHRTVSFRIKAQVTFK